MSVNGDVATRVPDGVSHLAYVMDEAAAAFARGDRDTGLLNLTHAVFVANRGEPLPDHQVIRLMRLVLEAALWQPEERELGEAV